MAGDWIKMRTNLDTDPRVIEMATTLQTSELHVVGMLWKVWAWADQHTLDGNAIRVTSVTLDRFTGCTGFADVLRKVGWLDGRDNAITFPRFAEHNGQTAKKRAETKERVAKHRNAKHVADVTQNALPEKRREEKNINKQTYTPEILQNVDFQSAWEKWKRHRSELFKPLGSVEAEAQLMELSRHGPEKALAMLQYSIRQGAKNLITNGDHEGRAAATINGNQQRKRVEVIS